MLHQYLSKSDRFFFCAKSKELPEQNVAQNCIMQYIDSHVSEGGITSMLESLQSE